MTQTISTIPDLEAFAHVIAAAWWDRPRCEIRTLGEPCKLPARYHVVCHECGRGLVCGRHLKLFLRQVDATQCNRCKRTFECIDDAISVVEL